MSLRFTQQKTSAFDPRWANLYHLQTPQESSVFLFYTLDDFIPGGDESDVIAGPHGEVGLWLDPDSIGYLEVTGDAVWEYDLVDLANQTIDDYYLQAEDLVLSSRLTADEIRDPIVQQWLSSCMQQYTQAPKGTDWFGTLESRSEEIPQLIQQIRGPETPELPEQL